MRVKQFISIIFLLALAVLPSTLHAQKDTVVGYYRDSTGRLFIAPETHVELYMGITTDGSKAIPLRNYPAGNNILHWNGHGPKHLSHYNLYLGRQIRFDLFVDGFAPKSEIAVKGTSAVDQDSIMYISSNAIIELTAKDKDAGIRTICYSLDNRPYEEYTQPIELKEPGKCSIAVYAIDNVGNTEDEFVKYFFLDNTPPVTQLFFEGDNYKEVVSARTKIIFKSDDALGIKNIQWWIDNGSETEYLKPISTGQLEEGEHTISFYATDLVGNIEPVKKFDIYVDKTPPMVFEEIVGNTYIVAGKEFSSGRSQLRVAAVDNKAGVKDIHFALNNKEYQVYEKPVYLSDLLGSINVKSYAVDNVGNKSTSSTESQFFSMPEIDITGPSIAYNLMGPKITLRDTLIIGSKTLIKVNASDLGAGLNKIIIKPKGSEEWDYSEPFKFTAEGFHEVTITAFDNVENINLINFAFKVDAEAPKVFYHFSTSPYQVRNIEGKEIGVYNANTILFLASTDYLSGVQSIEYSLNDEKYLPYREPIRVFKTSIVNSLKIKTIDLMGNESYLEVSFIIE